MTGWRVVPVVAALALFLPACDVAKDIAARSDATPSMETAPNGDQVPAVPFDREETEERARALLGLEEQAVPLGADSRIVRRGPEWLATTLDLQPGRMNIELDAGPDGTIVVTVVTVEVPDGHDPVVVESSDGG